MNFKNQSRAHFIKLAALAAACLSVSACEPRPFWSRMAAQRLICVHN